MSIFAFGFLIVQLGSAYGGNNVAENITETMDFGNGGRAAVRNNIADQLKQKQFDEVESFISELWDMATSVVVEKPAASKVDNLLSITKDIAAEGRSNMLKHKKGEIQFFMKTFLILKVILGLFLPLGVIAAKVLSWKAVTLSLMAFMLAKIMFVKNLISGPNTLSGGPPVYIQSPWNDLLWKRHGDHPTAYT